MITVLYILQYPATWAGLTKLLKSVGLYDLVAMIEEAASGEESTVYEPTQDAVPGKFDQLASQPCMHLSMYTVKNQVFSQHP